MSEENFLSKMRSQINSCITEFNERFYNNFCSTLSKSNLSDTIISQHNNLIFDRISTTHHSGSILNAILFLIPSPTLNASKIFEIISKIYYEKRLKSQSMRAILHLKKIISSDEKILNDFSSLFEKKQTKKNHFFVLGENLSKITFKKPFFIP